MGYSCPALARIWPVASIMTPLVLDVPISIPMRKVGVAIYRYVGSYELPGISIILKKWGVWWLQHHNSPTY